QPATTRVPPTTARPGTCRPPDDPDPPAPTGRPPKPTAVAPSLLGCGASHAPSARDTPTKKARDHGAAGLGCRLGRPEPRVPAQRTTSTGMVLWVITEIAWLPSSKRFRPRRPWVAITIRSAPRSFAVARIASPG